MNGTNDSQNGCLGKAATARQNDVDVANKKATISRQGKWASAGQHHRIIITRS